MLADQHPCLLIETLIEIRKYSYNYYLSIRQRCLQEKKHEILQCEFQESQVVELDIGPESCSDPLDKIYHKHVAGAP